MKLYTVARNSLQLLADSIERTANESLPAYVLTGTTERYAEAMRQVRDLRAAAAERSIHIRREILRNAGFEIASIREFLASA